MGIAPIFNDPIRHVFIDSKGHKCYQFPGVEGHFRCDKTTPAELPIRSNHWEIYKAFFVTNKKDGTVEKRKRIRIANTREKAVEVLNFLEEKSKVLSKNKSKIKNASGFHSWLLAKKNLPVANVIFKGLNDTDISLIEGASKVIPALYDKEIEIDELEGEIIHSLDCRLRETPPAKVLSWAPEFRPFFEGSQKALRERDIELIIKNVNSLFRRAKSSRAIDKKLRAEYTPRNPGEIGASNHHLTNTLTEDERELFHRFQAMLNVFFRGVDENSINPQIRSANLAALLKTCCVQRGPLFEDATIDLFKYKLEIDMKTHQLDLNKDANRLRKHFTLILIPTHLSGTNKIYRNVVVPFSIEDDLYNFCLPRIELWHKLRKLGDSRIPYILSRNKLGIDINGNSAEFTVRMLARYFDRIQKGLGFEGRMTPYSVKNQYYKNELARQMLENAMKKVGNTNAAIVKTAYLPITIDEDHIIHADELIASAMMADEFDARYEKIVELGLEGIGKRAILWIEKITGKSIS